jgi:DNA mismatch repair endonuclease MutH
MKSYAYASEAEILARARQLIGKRVSDLDGFVTDIVVNEKEKGQVGNIIQHYGFGLPPNSLAEPDFTGERIELKIIPLTRSGKGQLRVKERTKVCSINYQSLVKETWDFSHAQAKLNKILFIVVEHNYDQKFESKILDAFMFRVPEVEDYAVIQEDWTRTQSTVQEGQAHEISESHSKILAASRAGAGGAADLVVQPYSSIKAPKRAFSLKPSYTNAIIEEYRLKGKMISLSQLLGIPSESVLTETLRRLNEWEGKSVAEFAVHFQLSLNAKSKSVASSMIRAALELKGENSRIKEFEREGIIIKTQSRKLGSGEALEHLSFPHQPMKSIAEEEYFEDSQLSSYLQSFLFIPIYKPSKKSYNLAEWKIGRAYHWKPSDKELHDIKKEWTLFRDKIREGINLTKVSVNSKRGFIIKNDLPKSSETRYIHMRPHGRDGSDVDKSMEFNGKYIVKMSFWLTQK